jgi:hypothetical protein
MNSRSAAVLFACALFGAGSDALAAGRVRVDVGQLEFQGLAIEGLELELEPTAAAAGKVAFRAARIRGLAATGPLSKFSLDCPDLRIKGNEVSCERGRLSGSLGSLGAQDTRFTAHRRADGGLRLSFDAFGIAGGRGRFDVDLDGSRWRADATLAGLDIAGLALIAKPWVKLPADFTVAGRAAGEFHATGAGDFSLRRALTSTSRRSTSPTRRARSPARGSPDRSR